MKNAARAAFALLAASLPIYAQDGEPEKLKKELERVTVDQQVFVRQLAVQLAEIKELTSRIEEHRTKLARAVAEKATAVAELQYARQLAEKLKEDLAELEEKHATIARDKKTLEAKLNDLVKPGANVHPVPKKPLEGKVTAVAAETGLVVISIGKDDGVQIGDEFAVSRVGEFVSRIQIDRTDRAWSSGRVVLKKTDPRVLDDVSNRIAVSAPRPSSAGPVTEQSIEALRDVRKELDLVRRHVRALSDKLLAAWARDGIAAEEASDELRVHLGIERGILVRRVREGSPADRIGLKAMDVAPELSESGLLESIEEGKALQVFRQGKLLTLGGK